MSSKGKVVGLIPDQGREIFSDGSLDIGTNVEVRMMHSMIDHFHDRGGYPWNTWCYQLNSTSSFNTSVTLAYMLLADKIVSEYFITTSYKTPPFSTTH